MTDRPYHHGHLRATLLAEAERTLREQGVDALSLRDLARQAGVSHAAPRRHFADRQALLEALAEAGFRRLGEEVAAAVDAAGDDYRARLHAAASAYVRFATVDGDLLQLMFTGKNAAGSGLLPAAAAGLFTVVDGLIVQGQGAGLLPLDDLDRMRMLLAAMLQGIAALVVSGRVPAGQADALVSDAVTLFVRG